MSADEFDELLEEEINEKEASEKKEEQREEAEEEKTEEITKKEKKRQEKKEEIVVEKKEEQKPEIGTHIFALRTTANREDQVLDFITSNINKKGMHVFSIIRPHGMRGYIFMEAATRSDAEQAAFNIPYARGILAHPVKYSEIEHMLEQVKHEMNIQKNDIVEIISGPFKRENAKVTRIDKTKEEVVVELLEAAVPIPITVKMDAVKVIRRETETSPATEEETGEEGL